MAKIIIGIADMKVSADSSDILTTYCLGSCIGLSLYDPVAKVGGILHYMLPDDSINPLKGEKNPCMFGSTGIPRLFKACYQLGAEKKRLIVKVAGGGQVMNESGMFNIGKRNYAFLRKILWKNNVMIDAENIGGSTNRSMILQLSDGQVKVKISREGMVML
jgi:chemotaxis protein CheD